jgi:hypothetical protein
MTTPPLQDPLTALQLHCHNLLVHFTVLETWAQQEIVQLIEATERIDRKLADAQTQIATLTSQINTLTGVSQ